jgi:hypothetical protein
MVKISAAEQAQFILGQITILGLAMVVMLVEFAGPPSGSGLTPALCNGRPRPFAKRRRKRRRCSLLRASAAPKWGRCCQAAGTCAACSRSLSASRRHSAASLRSKARRWGSSVCSAERAHSSACCSYRRASGTAVHPSKCEGSRHLPPQVTHWWVAGCCGGVQHWVWILVRFGHLRLDSEHFGRAWEAGERSPACSRDRGDRVTGDEKRARPVRGVCVR